MAGLSPSFGRGAMTNHVVDLKNTDFALIMGSNAAENHPVTMKWLTKARLERGAKIIHVDPRFTRTSQVADLYAPLRSGTDIAFLGGMVKYIIDNERYHKDYVVNYTDAPFIVKEGFSFHDGLFSGYNPEKGQYDNSSWDYEVDEEGKFVSDPTLQHPRCVFQLMKKHYSRYDIDTVCNITGTPKNKYLRVLEMYTQSGAPDKTGNIMYAMGTTQHTVGTQNVRSYAVIQLLLGNMGRPGGGVNALRGENNVQGSTDQALLFHIIPGYITSPSNSPAHKNLEAFLAKETPKTGFKVNQPKWVVSLLKAWYGDAAQPNNDFAYHYIPKREADKNYSHIAMFEAMHRGELDGLFIWGGNPVVGGPHANKEQEAMCNLKWLVAADLWLTESADFWTYQAWDRPASETKVKKRTPADIKTEVFFLPAAAVYEKEGTAANTGRWVQYRGKAAEPVGDSMPDLWFIYEIGKRLQAAYANSKDPKDEPIKYMTWGPYGDGHEPSVVEVGLEMNGYYVDDPRKPVPAFAKLAADGSTACGNWIYCGQMTTKENGELDYKPMWRDNKDNSKTGLGLYSNWSWCWPVNRRVLYNRCSVQPDGVTPWPGDEKRQLIGWDPLAVSDPLTGKLGKWVGDDVPDFNTALAPTEPGGINPYIMRPEGKGCLFAAKASTKDGPFPEHYEPWESPFPNLMSKQQNNPAIKVWEPDKQANPDQYPIIGTTYRVVEHWQTGALTRNLPWLAELMPNMFVEMSEQLAKIKGIRNGDKVIITTIRGDVEAVACVTKRFKPFVVDGRTVHQIGTVWHFGFNGYAKGDPANRLTPHIGDANTMIPEYKAWLCDVRRA